jgi:hypothetical protein
VGEATWTCPACRSAVGTRYCATCGEEPMPARDLTLRGLAEKVFHAFTSIDARLLRTVRVLLRQPGELTRAWVAGVRRPYVAPFQLFLIANVFFFTVQWLTGENVFSSSLESHLHHQDWSPIAQSALAERLADTHRSLEEFAPAFDRAVALNAKSLILLMTLPFALLLPLVFLRERRPFMAHVVFSLHVYAYLLVVFCAALAAGKLCELAGFGGIEAPMVDNVISVALVLLTSVYVYLAVGPAYGTGGVRRVVQAFVLVALVAALVLGYRFALFFITLYGV